MWSVIKTPDRVKGWLLSVVPNTWLTSNGKYVFWPTSHTKDMQLRLAMDPKSKPTPSWSMIECLLTQSDISSYAEANSFVHSMYDALELASPTPLQDADQSSQTYVVRSLANNESSELHIFRELQKITKTLDIQQTKLDLILGSAGIFHPPSVSIAKIDFKRIEDKLQLRELNSNLEEDSFRINLV